MIFVGQAPSRDGSTNLEGEGARRLLEVMDVSRDVFLRHERVNLLAEYPGSSDAGGDLFDHQLARDVASDLVSNWNFSPNKTIILLGRAVQRAFLPMCPAVDYFKSCCYSWLTF